MALTAPMPQTAKPNGDKRELHCTSERPACWQSVDICGRQDMHRLCSAEAVRKSSAVSYTHRQVGRQAGTTNLGPVKDGGTKAGLQAELVPVLLSDVSVELGEQVAGVHDRGGYGQARRALEFLAPGAAWLGQQPTHTHAHTHTFAELCHRRRHVSHFKWAASGQKVVCSQESAKAKHVL